MKLAALTFTLAIGISLVGCGNTTASRSVSGAAIGAGGGAAIGAIAGNAALGAGIGAGVGLVGGYLYDQQQKGNIDY
jgi:hypothetical protein